MQRPKIRPATKQNRAESGPRLQKLESSPLFCEMRQYTFSTRWPFPHLIKTKEIRRGQENCNSPSATRASILPIWSWICLVFNCQGTPNSERLIAILADYELGRRDSETAVCISATGGHRRTTATPGTRRNAHFIWTLHQHVRQYLFFLKKKTRPTIHTWSCHASTGALFGSQKAQRILSDGRPTPLVDDSGSYSNAMVRSNRI